MSFTQSNIKLMKSFLRKVKQWCEEAGGNITIKTVGRGVKQTATGADDSNPFWVAFKSGVTAA